MTSASAASHASAISARKLLVGFVAGFIAVLLFHQPALALLTELGFAKATTYAFNPVPPLGVPRVISIAFWGGVWGVAYAAIEQRLPRGGAYWLGAFLFGAILPTLVAWFVVAPIKGLPVAGGWQASRMLTGFVINGAWGLGPAVLMTLALRRRR